MIVEFSDLLGSNDMELNRIVIFAKYFFANPSQNSQKVSAQIILTKKVIIINKFPFEIIDA